MSVEGVGYSKNVMFSKIVGFGILIINFISYSYDIDNDSWEELPTKLQGSLYSAPSALFVDDLCGQGSKSILRRTVSLLFTLAARLTSYCTFDTHVTPLGLRSLQRSSRLVF